MPQETFKIYVKFASLPAQTIVSKTCVCEIETFMLTVLEIKRMIHKAESIPTKFQRLVLNQGITSIVLDDLDTLRHYGILPNSMIHLELALDTERLLFIKVQSAECDGLLEPEL